MCPNMDRDREADKLALAGALGVVPFAFAVLGCWMWPLFNSAGQPEYQIYRFSEILTGFVGGGVVGIVIGAVLLAIRARTETPEESSNH